MKKIFYFFAAALMVATMIPVSIVATITINNFEQDAAGYPPTSFINLIRNLNSRIDMKEMEKNKVVRDVLDEEINKAFHTLFDNKEGNLVSSKMDSIGETYVQSFSNTYTNNTSHEQTFKTQEYSETITNMHSFSVALKEKISVGISFKILFIENIKINVEVSSEQKWTYNTTTEKKLINPSQSFIVSPYSLGKALYVIRQGTYRNEGVIRFPIDLETLIWLPVFDETDNSWYSLGQTVEYIISKEKDLGYADLMKLDCSEYSLISTDNSEVPTIAYLNLPIIWDSQGGKIDVNFTEETL